MFSDKVRKQAREESIKEVIEDSTKPCEGENNMKRSMKKVGTGAEEGRRGKD